MKKTFLIILCVLMVFAVSCRTMKKQLTVKTPETVDEQKNAETEAKNLYEEGKYDDAISYLKALIEKDPNNPVYWGQLGSAYAQINDYKGSVNALKQAIKLNPKDSKSMYNLSLVLTENGAHMEAQKIIQEALALNPKNALMQASLGNILIDEEKYDKAKQVYEQIVEARPDYDVGHFNLGIINYQERNLDAAEKNYEEVLKINPADSGAKENLSAIYIIKNQYEEAIDLLLEVINSSPDDDMVLENAYYNIGVAYLRIKKYKEALESFEAAISIEPWDMAAYVNAAILSEELGLKDKAIKYWQKYDRLLPVNKRKKEIQERLKKLGVKTSVTPAAAKTPASVVSTPVADQKEKKKEADK